MICGEALVVGEREGAVARFANARGQAWLWRGGGRAVWRSRERVRVGELGIGLRGLMGGRVRDSDRLIARYGTSIFLFFCSITRTVAHRTLI